MVDDDASSRDAIAAIVQSMGVPFQVFVSGEAFLDAHHADAPGCLVTDIRMTGITGLDLLEHMRESTISLPVILITAFADVPLAVRAMQRGAFTLLEKPCRSHELWQAIHDALELDETNRRRRDVRRLTVDRLASLTPEEQGIVEAIMQGTPNKAIAMQIGMSLRTIESRRRAIFEKLGVDSATALVRLVLEARRDP